MSEGEIKILVAEDDKFLSKIYEVKLNKEGFNVKIACDGEEAVTMAKEFVPNIILLDLIMPKKDGFEALAEIKADPLLKDIPVIILSNLGQDEDIKRGKDLGATDYIIKADIAIEDVVTKIKTTLG